MHAKFRDSYSFASYSIVPFKEVTMEAILGYLFENTGIQCNKKSDLYGCGMYDDSLSDFLYQFFGAYKVEYSSYLEYFHHDVDGLEHRGTKNTSVNRISITPQILFDAAKSGQWRLDYPEHTPPVISQDLHHVNKYLTALTLTGITFISLYLAT